MIDYSIRINMQGERVQYENIVFTTGDKRGYCLHFAFYSNGSRVDVSGYALAVKARRADGEVILDSGETEGKDAYYIVADNAYNVEGLLEFEVALVGPDESLATVHVIRTQVREGFGEANLAPEDATPVLAKAAAATERATTAAEHADRAAQDVTEAKALAEAAAVEAKEIAGAAAEEAKALAQTAALHADAKAALAEEKAAEAVQATEAAEQAEQARKAAEAERVSAENARADAESSRVTAETLRAGAENARVDAERERIAAETQREDNESMREENEAGRDQAEAKRMQSEQERAAAEIVRDNNETVRIGTEQQRIESENARLDAEIARDAAETARNTAEAERDEAEAARKAAETERSEAEKVRQTVFSETYNRVSNSFTGQKSGFSVRTDDMSPVEHEVAVTVRSKNLIPTPYEFTEQTKNGCTMVVNENGSVTISGTATADASFRLKRFDGLLYAGKTLTVAATTSVLRMYVHVRNQAGTWTFNFIRSDKANNTAIIPKGTTMLEVGVMVSPSFDGTETTFYPQLEIGTQATEYVPYVAPASVTLTRLGKNLVPAPYEFTEKTVKGVTAVVNSDFSVTLSGTLAEGETSDAVFRLGIFDAAPYRGASLCIPAVAVAGLRSVLHVKLEDGNWTYNFLRSDKSGNLFGVIPEDAVLFDYSVAVSSSFDGAATMFYPLLESGEAATAYEPYIEPATYTPDEAGHVSGVASLAPTMTLLTGQKGVMIDCTYNRDANKVYEELVNAIISLGGNV